MKDQLEKLEKRIKVVEDKVVKLEKEDIKTEIHLNQLIDSMANVAEKMDVYLDRINQVENETSKNSDTRAFSQDIVKEVVKWLIILIISTVLIGKVL